MTATATAIATREELLAQADAWIANEWDPRNGQFATPIAIEALRLTIAAALAPSTQTHDSKPEVEDGWYEIELMGHRVRTGHLRCLAFAGRQLVEICEPAHPAGPPENSGDDAPELISPRVEFYSPTAIFSLTPITEEIAIRILTDRGHYPF